MQVWSTAAQRAHMVLAAGDGDPLASHVQVPWLARFKELSAYTRCKPEPEGGRLTGYAFREYYGSLIRKYIPEQQLRW